MIRLQTKDLKDVLEVSRCALECESMERLQQDTLTLIERSLGARSSVYAHFNKNHKQIKMIEGAEHGVPNGAMARWCSTYHSDDPFMRRYLTRLSTRSNNVIVSNDVVNHNEYVSTSFYNEFMKPQSIYHVMIIGLESDRGPIGVFGLHRSISAPAFSKAEVAKANLLVPHLKGAVERIAARELLSECQWIADRFANELANDGIAILDQDLKTVYISHNAQQLLGCNDQLPDPFLVACGNCLSAHDITESPAHFCFKTARRTIRAEVRALESINSFPRFIIRLDTSLQEAPSTPQITIRMKKLGLSRREMDVAQLLSQGLTSMEIADKLYISVRTVNNHLRSIYEKAGVHNRASLIYRLNAPHQLASSTGR